MRGMTHYGLKEHIDNELGYVCVAGKGKGSTDQDRLVILACM